MEILGQTTRRKVAWASRCDRAHQSVGLRCMHACARSRMEGPTRSVVRERVRVPVFFASACVHVCSEMEGKER